MWNSSSAILDEPTAALGVAQTKQVLELVKRLGEQGLAVILISHNLHDIFQVADLITVLRLGQNVAVYKRSETNQQQRTGRLLGTAASTVRLVPAWRPGAKLTTAGLIDVTVASPRSGALDMFWGCSRAISTSSPAIRRRKPMPEPAVLGSRRLLRPVIRPLVEEATGDIVCDVNDGAIAEGLLATTKATLHAVGKSDALEELGQIYGGRVVFHTGAASAWGAVPRCRLAVLDVERAFSGHLDALTALAESDGTTAAGL